MAKQPKNAQERNVGLKGKKKNAVQDKSSFELGRVSVVVVTVVLLPVGVLWSLI